MVKSKLFNLTFTIFIIVFFLIFILIQNDQPQNRLDIVNTSISPKILALYQNNCASCHGENLQGQIGWQNALDEDGHRLAPPLNGSAHTWHHSPEYLFPLGHVLVPCPCLFPSLKPPSYFPPSEKKYLP